MRAMAEGVRVLLAVLAAMSVVVVAGYVIVFLAAATCTVVRRDRRDPLAAALDRVLDDVLRSETPVRARGQQGEERAR